MFGINTANKQARILRAPFDRQVFYLSVHMFEKLFLKDFFLFYEAKVWIIPKHKYSDIKVNLRTVKK